MKKLIFLTLNEREIIQDLLVLGLSYAQIAKKLGRSGQCVSREVNKNTANGPYDAKKAHLRAYSNRKKNDKVTCKKTFEESAFLLRISNIEQQIEIILDQLKELYERNSKNN